MRTTTKNGKFDCLEHLHSLSKINVIAVENKKATIKINIPIYVKKDILADKVFDNKVDVELPEMIEECHRSIRNLAERDLRPMKITQKMNGGCALPKWNRKLMSSQQFYLKSEKTKPQVCQALVAASKGNSFEIIQT